MCIGSDCNDPLQVPSVSIAVQNGVDGASAYLYCASADDINGLNFSYPEDPNQIYKACRSTTTPLTPVAGDFSGHWYRSIGNNGTPGTNGTNGLDAGFEYKFLRYSGSGDPGSHNLQFDNTNATTSLNVLISTTTNAGGVIDNTLALVGASTNSTKCLMKITKKGDNTKFVSYQVFSSTNNGTYFSLNVNHLDCTDGATHLPFTAGDVVMITLSIAGDKGLDGTSGGATPMIIGTLDTAGANIAYPHPVLAGQAYRFINSDLGTIGAAPLRVFIDDVLYCHTDTTAPNDASKFTIIGYKRPFVKGAGVDSFIHNTATGIGTTAGIKAISISGGAGTGDRSFAGAAGIASGTESVAYGSGVTASGANSVAIGSNLSAAAANSGAFGTTNYIAANAIGAFALGYSHTVDTGAPYSFTINQFGRPLISNSFVKGVTDKVQSIQVPIYVKLNFNAVGASAVMTPGPTSGTIVYSLGANGVWRFNTEVVAYNITAGTRQFQTTTFLITGQAKSVAGVASFLGTPSVVKLFSDAGTDHNIVLSIGTNNIIFTASTAGASAAETVVFNGSLYIKEIIL